MNTKITHIKIKNNEALLAAMAPRLKKACTEACATHMLSLDSQHITDLELSAHIIPFLNANPAIQTLNIEYNKIGDAGAQALAQNTTLQTLNIRNNNIGAVGAQALAQNTTLQTLNIGSNNIGDAGTQALAQNTTLQTLNIVANNIGAAGAQALAQNTTLQTLNVGHNEIGDAGAQALAQNTTLQTLNVGYNAIGAVGAQALAQNTTLQTLDIEYSIIGAVGAQALAQNTTLQTLNIGTNNIGDEGAQAFSDALLAHDNQSLINIRGITLTAKMEVALELNAERATYEECCIIVNPEHLPLCLDVQSLILEYRGRTIGYINARLPKTLACTSSAQADETPAPQDERLSFSPDADSSYTSANTTTSASISGSTTTNNRATETPKARRAIISSALKKRGL